MNGMMSGKRGMGMSLSAKLNGISRFGSHGVLITDPAGEVRDEKGHGIGGRGTGQGYHPPVRKIRPFCKGGEKRR